MTTTVVSADAESPMASFPDKVWEDRTVPFAARQLAMTTYESQQQRASPQIKHLTLLHVHVACKHDTAYVEIFRWINFCIVRELVCTCNNKNRNKLSVTTLRMRHATYPQKLKTQKFHGASFFTISQNKIPVKISTYIDDTHQYS